MSSVPCANTAILLRRQLTITQALNQRLNTEVELYRYTFSCNFRPYLFWYLHSKGIFRLLLLPEVGGVQLAVLSH